MYKYLAWLDEAIEEADITAEPEDLSPIEDDDVVIGALNDDLKALLIAYHGFAVQALEAQDMSAILGCDTEEKAVIAQMRADLAKDIFFMEVREAFGCHNAAIAIREGFSVIIAPDYGNGIIAGALREILSGAHGDRVKVIHIV